MSTNSEKLFRQSALERLSSPEQLDKLVTVTDSMGWAGLFSLLSIIVIVLLWSVFGKIPYNVTGQGILVSRGGQVYNAMSPAAGTVLQLPVRINHSVQQGDVLVVIAQEELTETTASARAMYAQKLQEKERVLENQRAEAELKLSNFKQQKASQRDLIEVARRRQAYLENALNKREDLQRTGLLSKQAVEESRQQYNQVVQDIAAANNRILELTAQELDLQSDHFKVMVQLDQEIESGKRKVEELVAQLTRTTRVVAPAAGTVTELKVAIGTVVQAGTPVASIASSGQALQAVIYVPTRDGKRVQPGMPVRVAPATVKKEEFGTLIGAVAEVSAFPATREGMQTVLQNQSLVDQFALQGAPYATRIDLSQSEATPSGYKWTSSLGPNLRISAGTTVTAEITVQEVSPISLVLPFLRQQPDMPVNAGATGL